jgi:hypothetical protein
MNHKVFALVLLVFVMISSSCQEKKKIPREEMISILVDIHLLDGVIQQDRYRQRLKMPDSLNVYSHVLEKHGYTREQFDSTMNFYSRDPRKFERIYQDVMSRLNRMETRAREEKEKKRQEDKQSGKTEKHDSLAKPDLLPKKANSGS